MVTHVDEISTPPTPADPPAVFEERAAQVWSDLARAIPQLNQQADENNAAAIAAGQSEVRAIAEADAALGYRNEANASKLAAQAAAGGANTAKSDAQAAQTAAESARDTAQGYAASIGQAVAMAATFTAVPATFQAACIVVTQPHLRFMVWNGVKYVRAPWHRPGVLFFSHAPAANITHGIQVRADVTYNKADHPDLAEILGVSGSAFVLPEGRARVLRAADLGAGVDASLVNGYLQDDAIRNIVGRSGHSVASFSGAYSIAGSGPFRAANNNASGPTATAGSGSWFEVDFDASRAVPVANENRVKSLTATLYITR